MPYPEPDRLLDVSMAPPGKPESKGVVTPALYLLLRDKTSAAFEAVGAFDAGDRPTSRATPWAPHNHWTGIEFRRRASRRSAPDL